ncbi:MAG TPA: hypothetical protein VN086_02015 [Candidatus Paceibacterota bacterium]|nr:hypothetical protein [Candidatus Paceibacterota bacterium]
MTEYNPEPFVVAGALFMDSKEFKPGKPAWHHDVILDELDMEDPDDCVLGQTWGGYLPALTRFGIQPGSSDLIYLGFDVPAEPAETKSERYALLTAAWKKLIQERLASAA